MHYLLIYELADDYLDRRAQFRNEHLAKGWAAQENGDLVLGGALANPTDQAILLFKGDSPAVAEAFAKSDPYVLNGIVKHWRVREWTTVIGEGCANPVRPV
ncbi:MAG: YciI-like protein [Acidobacteriota bacterium]